MARKKAKRSSTTALETSNRSLAEAERLIQAGQLPLAASVLDDLQSRVEGDARIYLLGMRLAEASGDPAAALKAARLAVKTQPEWASAVLELALCLARQNQFREAAAEAEKAVAMAPENLRILDGAIQVAHRAGYAAMALELLPKAIALSKPEGANAYRRMQAHDLLSRGQAGEALKVFDELVNTDPKDEASLRGRAQAAQLGGDAGRAIDDWQTLLALHPNDDSLKFHLAVAQGKPPATQPISMARALFDSMADTYDQRMVRELQYRLPKEVGDWALETFPERKLNVLDLGCGTGLLGVCLGKTEGFIIGVDVSEKMIEQAARHGLYYRFHKVNLLDALRETPSDMYELITALDVFIYCGELGQVIADAFRVTKPGGYFVFSCERALEDEADMVLRPTNRYAHKQSHIEVLCRAAGFDGVAIRDTALRVEKDQPVNGFVVTAHKPTPA